MRQQQDRVTSTPVVEVTRVGRSFGDLTVLTNVDFTLPAGDVRGLIGPNGVGKTTLLRIIAGLVDPTTGEVTVLGANPSEDAVRSRVGWIPGGDRTFYLRLSGAANLAFFGRMYGLSRREASHRAAELLTRVGLDHAGKRPTGLYSKGMLKRLSVARALIPSPAVLLCDETTHDLDPEGATTIRGLIAGLASEGTAVLWATQRLDELVGFAGAVTVLSREGVAYSGPLAELLQRLPQRSFTIATGITDSEAVDAVLDPLPGVVHSREAGDIAVVVSGGTTIGQVIASLDQAGVPITSVSETGSRVEAAYRHVLGQDEA